MVRRLAAPWSLAMAVLVVGSCGWAPADPPEPPAPVYALRRDAVTGHCLTGPEGAYHPVACIVDHSIEVTGTVDYPDTMPYPSGLPLQFFADCDAGFAEYVGVAPTRQSGVAGLLRSVPIIPSEDAWSLGDTRVVCTARADRPWAGSVRGLGELEPPPAMGIPDPAETDCLC